MDNLTFSGPMVQEIQDVLDILVYGTTATDTHHSQFPANLRATSSFVSNAVDYFSHGLGEQNHSMDAVCLATTKIYRELNMYCVFSNRPVLNINFM